MLFLGYSYPLYPMLQHIVTAIYYLPLIMIKISCTARTRFSSSRY